MATKNTGATDEDEQCIMLDEEEMAAQQTKTIKINNVPQALAEKWRKAVNERHGKYRGAMSEEAMNALEFWADMILDNETTPTREVSNEELLEKLNQIESSLKSNEGRQSFEGLQTKNNSQGGNPDTGQKSVENTEDGDFARERILDYRPGMLRKTELEYINEHGTAILSNIIEHQDEPEIAYCDLDDSPLPKDRDAKARIVAAVMRSECDGEYSVTESDMINWVENVIGVTTNSYVRDHHLPVIKDELYAHPGNASEWFVAERGYNKARAKVRNEHSDLKRATEAVIAADGQNEIVQVHNQYSSVSEALDDISNKLKTYKGEMIESGLVEEDWFEVVNEQISIMQMEMLDTKVDYDSYLAERPSVFDKIISSTGN